MLTFSIMLDYNQSYIDVAKILVLIYESADLFSNEYIIYIIYNVNL